MRRGAAMIEQLTKNERQLAIVILLGLTVCGLALLAAGQNDPLGVHGGLIMAAAIRRHLRRDLGLLRARTGGGAARQLLRRSEQDRHHPRHGLGRVRPVRRRLGGLAAGLAGPHLRCRLVELRPAASRPHHRRDLRLRRQCADRDLLLRHAANVAGAAARPAQPVVRAVRLQPVLRARRHRLPDGHHPVEGICRARMVRRHLAGRSSG